MAKLPDRLEVGEIFRAAGSAFGAFEKLQIHDPYAMSLQGDLLRLASDLEVASYPEDLAEEIEVAYVRAQHEVQPGPQGLGIQYEGQVCRGAAQGRMKRRECAGEPFEVFGGRQ